MRRFGLIGYPLEHSFSQKYFTKKFKQENIENCYYGLFPIASLDLLNDIFISHPDLEGLNVTIPFKKSILRHLNSVSNLPEGLHACNCIKVVDGRLIGYNTDAIGFEKSLTPLLKPQHKKAMVLGNGGAAVAVVYVLNKLGIEYTVVGREIKPGIDLLYAGIDEEVMKNHLLIINTTPVGMFPNIEHVPPIPMDFITRDHVCYDLIYNPERTLFLRQAESWGATIKNGHEMLVIQAEESWKIWNEKA